MFTAPTSNMPRSCDEYFTTLSDLMGGKLDSLLPMPQIRSAQLALSTVVYGHRGNFKKIASAKDKTKTSLRNTQFPHSTKGPFSKRLSLFLNPGI